MLGERIADLGLPAGAPGARLRRPRLGQGGGAAVRPLRGLRRAARPRDALDRRGDGHRARLPDRVREGAGGRRRAAAERGHGLHHASPTKTRPAPSGSPRPCTTTAFASSPRAAPPRRSRAWACPCEPLNKIGEGSPHVLDWIERGDVDLVVNTPTGVGARTDGWEIRRAAVAPRHPLPDDARGRALGGPRDRRRARASGEPRGAVPAGAPRRAARRRRAPRAGDPDARRPGGVSGAQRFGRRRRCGHRAYEELGAYRLLRVARPERPGCAEPGQFAMLAAVRALGRRRGRAAVPARAPSRSRGATRQRVPSSCSRTSGPGTRRLCELRAGERLWLLGPLGRGFRRPPAGRRALLVGGGVGIAPLAILQDRSRSPGATRAARLPRRRARPRRGAVR